MATSKTELQARKLRKSELSQMAGQLAKTANQRLRSLEQAGLANASNAYRYIERLHFDKDSATATDSKGRMKFNTNFRDMSYQDIQHEISEITRFLEAKTSTPARVKEKYARGYHSFINKYEEAKNLSFEDYTDIMRNETIKNTKQMFASKVMLRIMRHMDETEESLTQVLERIKSFDTLNGDMAELEELLKKEMPWQQSSEETENDNITDGGNIT